MLFLKLIILLNSLCFGQYEYKFQVNKDTQIYETEIISVYQT